MVLDISLGDIMVWPKWEDSAIREGQALKVYFHHEKYLECLLAIISCFDLDRKDTGVQTSLVWNHGNQQKF